MQKNFRPQICATKPQWDLEPVAAGTLIFLTKTVLKKKKDSKRKPHVLYIYQHVIFTM